MKEKVKGAIVSFLLEYKKAATRRKRGTFVVRRERAEHLSLTQVTSRSPLLSLAHSGLAVVVVLSVGKREREERGKRSAGF